jgi:protein-L-isoaspartate(D-aspartate) O-methyltransferase
MDYPRARDAMVESQVRPSDVTDLPLVAALRTLPRERFVPAHLRALAYAEIDLEVAPGRFLLRPRDLAKLYAALEPRPRDRALELNGATGYGAAVLASCVAFVVAQDSDPGLSQTARGACEAAGLANVKSVSCPVERGWPDDAPYDLMVLNGGAEIVPEAWFAQLAEGGRLGVIVRSGAAGQARVYVKTGGVVAYRTVFDAAPAVVPALARPAAFAF